MTISYPSDLDPEACGVLGGAGWISGEDLYTEGEESDVRHRRRKKPIDEADCDRGLNRQHSQLTNGSGSSVNGFDFDENDDPLLQLRRPPPPPPPRRPLQQRRNTHQHSSEGLSAEVGDEADEDDTDDDECSSLCWLANANGICWKPKRGSSFKAHQELARKVLLLHDYKF